MVNSKLDDYFDEHQEFDKRARERERELMHGIVLKKKILIMNEKRGRIAPFSSGGDLKVLLDKVYI